MNELGMMMSGGKVIVETNFRLYGYIHHDVQIEILSLFAAPEYILPNMYVGRITQQSVMDALRGGIAIDQIVSYLRARAEGDVLPQTVVDQMVLWSEELNRVTFADGVLYENCDASTFMSILQYARKQGVLLWTDYSESDVGGGTAATHGRRIVVKKDAHVSVRQMLKEKQQSARR